MYITFPYKTVSISHSESGFGCVATVGTKTIASKIALGNCDNLEPEENRTKGQTLHDY
jgi:hypothetical protein